MKVAEIENGEVVNVLLLSAVALEQFREATGKHLVSVPQDGDVIVGDLYSQDDGTFHRPEMAYPGDQTHIISVFDLYTQAGAMADILNALLGGEEHA
jgi:hypothetical protein